MRSARSLPYSLFAEIQQLGMERYRLNVPKARPGHRAILFGGKALAGFPGFAVHLRKDVGVEVALVQGDLAAAHDRRNYPRERLDAAHGANSVRLFPGDGADFKRQFCRGSKGVTPCV